MSPTTTAASATLQAASASTPSVVYTFRYKFMALMSYYLSQLPYQDSLQILEADIQQAAAITRARGGTLIKMKLVCNQLVPLFFFYYFCIGWIVLVLAFCVIISTSSIYLYTRYLS
ncbi:uncharacterized protein LOC123913838 [Trifolium pratense]|uniref:uncharacterized protein LOC123913838 n=1 Tax=Trifolium pratense TaxID=57577 RepID=UPI001E691A2B|nr:uncharacterized protein LOC123913838 [Trifolium pratense]